MGGIAAEIIASAAVVIAALIGIPIELLRRNARATREAVGQPNGQGNVVQMLERILYGQTGQDKRLARLEGRQHDHEIRLSVVEARTAGCPARQDQPQGD